MTKLTQILTEFITYGQLRKIEHHLDDLFGKVGIDVEFTKHFFERLNDKRNGKPIEPEELIELYTKTYKKYGNKLPNWREDSEALITDFNTNINIPFVLNYNVATQELEMVAKTVMRKKGFKTFGQTLKV